MESGWSLLALLSGLALGAIPPRVLYAEGHRHLTLLDARTSGMRRSSDSVGSVGGSGRRRRRWWKLPLVWADPLRGYACAIALGYGFAGIDPGGSAGAMALRGAQAIVLLGILAWQMERGHQGADRLLAPVGFLLGVCVGYAPWFSPLGTGVGLLALTAMFALHHFVWGYVIAGAAAVVLGFFLMGLSVSLPIFAAVASSPALYAFLRRKELVFPLRG